MFTTLKQLTTSLLFSVILMLTTSGVADVAIFDTHIHYNSMPDSEWSDERILNLLQKNQVKHAIVTGIPNFNTQSLYKKAPDIIIPFVSVYQKADDKNNWHQNKNLLKSLQQQLRLHHWLGIGELHLFAENRNSEVFRAILNLASQHNLIVQMHSDPAVIDHIYQLYPNLIVIWAHAGAYPYPPLLRDYLKRYPNLYLDVSMRNKLIAPQGRLDSDWESLMMEFTNRFMLGVDTFSELRWDNYHQSIETTRQWVKQLPDTVQQDISYRNAAQLFLKK